MNWWSGRLQHYGKAEDIGQFDQITRRDWVYATAMLIKRQVMETVSLLDPAFFFGIEEYDYCTSATRAGFKVVYVPTSKVWHKVGASRKKLPDFPETQNLIQRETGALQYKHFFRLFRKHSPRPLFLFAYLNFMTALAILTSSRVVKSHASGLWDHLRRKW